MGILRIIWSTKVVYTSWREARSWAMGRVSKLPWMDQASVILLPLMCSFSFISHLRKSARYIFHSSYNEKVKHLSIYVYTYGNTIRNADTWESMVYFQQNLQVESANYSRKSDIGHAPNCMYTWKIMNMKFFFPLQARLNSWCCSPPSLSNCWPNCFNRIYHNNMRLIINIDLSIIGLLKS